MRFRVQFCTDLYRTARRMPLGWVVVAVALVFSACSGDGRSAPPSTTTTPIPDVGLSPPGTPIAEGLVVPKGARLIGPAFWAPESKGDHSWAAVLDVGADPFAAWDDLAEQMRAKGAPYPRSGVCNWEQAVSGDGQPLIGPVSEAHPGGVHALDCEAGMGGSVVNGVSVYLEARLYWSPRGAELALAISEEDKQLRDPFAGPDPYPDRAPAGALALLPHRSDASLPKVGQPLGSRNDALERGQLLHVPPDARVVGGGRAASIADFEAVLAVGDAHAVLLSLGRQVDPTGPKVGDGQVTLTRQQTPGGRSIWYLNTLIQAGGGATEMWSSPDGKAVLVTTRSD